MCEKTKTVHAYVLLRLIESMSAVQVCLISRVNVYTYRVGRQKLFLEVRKFLSSFRYHKSPNVLGVPVQKSQIRKLSSLIRKS